MLLTGDLLSERKDNRGMSTGSGSAGLCNSAWVAHGYGRRRSFRRMKTMGKHSWVMRTQDSFLCTGFCLPTKTQSTDQTWGMLAKQLHR